MSKLKILGFIDQVKQEASKISWPTKKETTTSTAVVLVMVIICSIFFLLIDSVIHYLVQILLGIGN